MSVDDFQHLVREHRDRVFNLAYYSLRHREDAEDVTQEVLIRLWNHRRKLEAPAVMAWLMKVTRNACYDLHRRHGVRRKHFEEGKEETTLETVAADRPDPHDHAEASAFRQQLEAALRRLPEHYRTIVVLREIEGLKYDEIAEATGRQLSSVKVILHRGRKMLRDEMRSAGRAAQADAEARAQESPSSTASGSPEIPPMPLTAQKTSSPSKSSAPTPIRQNIGCAGRARGIVHSEREAAHA